MSRYLKRIQQFRHKSPIIAMQSGNPFNIFKRFRKNGQFEDKNYFLIGEDKIFIQILKT